MIDEEEESEEEEYEPERITSTGTIPTLVRIAAVSILEAQETKNNSIEECIKAFQLLGEIGGYSMDDIFVALEHILAKAPGDSFVQRTFLDAVRVYYKEMAS